MLATIAGLLLFAGLLFAAFPLLLAIKRRVLWRVRRKLTISYVFIGFVPAMLIIAFFLLCGLLLFFNTAGYMLRSRAAALVDHTEFLAQSAALDVARAATPAEIASALDRVHAGAAVRYPSVSYAVVPGERACGSVPVEEAGVRADVVLMGAWSHLAAPQSARMGTVLRLCGPRHAAGDRPCGAGGTGRRLDRRGRSFPRRGRRRAAEPCVRPRAEGRHRHCHGRRGDDDAG